MPQRRLFFGPYRLDLDAKRLWRGADPIALPPKPVALLHYFARNAGRLVTKQELLEHVWPGVHVCDAVLKNTVAVLRAVLGGGAAAYIETEPRRGYRFVAHVYGEDLPRPLATFIGRRRDVRQAMALVVGHRLVTFTGPPGCGKTSLAFMVARCARAGRLGGAWWVDVRTPFAGSSIERTVGRVLGVSPLGRETAFDAVARVLGDRDLLLVLNDCDRGLAGVVRFVRNLLRVSRGVHLLLTSRSPLGLPGERLLSVSPMEVPDDGVSQPAMLATDAVRLFVERAAEVQAGGTAPACDVSSVASICRQLDGLPLAIEIAASFARTFTPREILDRLHDVLGLSGPMVRRMRPGQLSLRRVFDDALDPLAADEHELLARLAALPQPFTLDDVERLWPTGPSETLTSAALLTRLAQRSLVSRARPLASGSSAYRVLEPLRAYVLHGRSQLARRRWGTNEGLRSPTGRAKSRGHRATRETA